jgi:glycosyltransferase involved in cell wall biosynthesis
MRIGIVVPNFTERIPSNELWVALGLSRRGHAVTVLTSNRLGEREKYLVTGQGDVSPESGFRIVRLPTIPAFYTEAAIPLGVGGALSDGYDVLLLQEDYPTICSIAGKVASRRGIPYLISCERYGYFAGPGLALVNKAYDILVTRRLWRRAAAMTFHSRASAAFLTSLGAPGRDTYYTPSPTNCEIFSPAPQSQLDQRVGIVRVLCVARLVRAKGLEWLTAAANELVRRGVQGFSILIQGRGPMSASLREAVRVLGIQQYVCLDETPISLPELPSFYRAGDIYVQPSLYEPFGLACREAAASGLPLVVANTGGLKDAVDNNITGYLVQPGDVNALATALESLIREKGRRREFGLSGRAKVEKESDYRKMALAYERIIETSLERRRRSSS